MESNLSIAPTPDLVYTPSQRRNVGVGRGYIDTYNETQMTRYNNEYNYWLWLQQMDYNSPVNQRKRLEAAGLNPNYQSIDSGNVSSMPMSSGKISGNVVKNQTAMMQQAISGFNAMIDSVAQGVKSYSELSGIPDDVSGYRRALSDYMKNQAGSSEADKLLKRMQSAFYAKTYLGFDSPFILEGYGPDGAPAFYQPDWEKASQYQRLLLQNSNLDLKNEDLEWLIKLRQYDFNNLKPQELELIKERIRAIGFQADLNEKQVNWFTTMSSTKIGAQIAPILLTVAKMLL